MGEQGGDGKRRGGKKTETSEAIISGRAVAPSVCMCMSVCVCNFIRLGRGRRSAWANNSLQTADVITF